MVTCHSALTMVSQHMIACVHHASCCELLSLAGQTAEKDTHSAQSVLHPFANCHPVCISPLPPSSQVWRILAMFGHVLGQYPPFLADISPFAPLKDPEIVACGGFTGHNSTLLLLGHVLHVCHTLLPWTAALLACRVAAACAYNR